MATRYVPQGTGDGIDVGVGVGVGADVGTGVSVGVGAGVGVSVGTGVGVGVSVGTGNVTATVGTGNVSIRTDALCCMAAFIDVDENLAKVTQGFGDEGLSDSRIPYEQEERQDETAAQEHESKAGNDQSFQTRHDVVPNLPMMSLFYLNPYPSL